jgi:SAM-dependent methyltransferase
MSDYDASTYGERWAETYDKWVARLGRLDDPEVVAGRLAELAAGGPVLELAIGTGRIALPLAGRGVDVHGIDISEQMVAKLRAKPGGAKIPVTMGDFADVPVEGDYALIYVVFNTLFALLSQDDQLRCFRNAAAHLRPGGVFVIEAFVPDVTLFDRGQRVAAEHVDTDAVRLGVSSHDPVAQHVTSVHVEIERGEVRMLPVQVRYAWPSELDLMARLAGLRLRQRWGGWREEPFTAASGQHVSVFERPE